MGIILVKARVSCWHCKKELLINALLRRIAVLATMVFSFRAALTEPPRSGWQTRTMSNMV